MSQGTDIPPLARLMRQLDAVQDGELAEDTVPTGFPSVDKMLGGGLRAGDLVILGGDVGSGKSALALSMALRLARAGRSVSYFTAEMTPERAMERALAMQGRVRIDDIRLGTLGESGRAAVGAAALQLRDRAPAIERLPPGGIEVVADELRSALDAELVIVDSLQALAHHGIPDDVLPAAVVALKTLALELGVALLLTSHLPHLPSERRDMRPRLDDYGARGAVKQHADVILSLFREEMYAGTAGGIEGATELLVSKNRNGPTGYADLYFYKQWLRFEDVLDTNE